MLSRRLLLTAPFALALSGCRAAEDTDLRLMVPNAPGSGYDITARTVSSALTINAEVFHLPGGSGRVGLQRLRYERGNGHLLMLMGLGLIGAATSLDDVTPIARLLEEPEVVVVTADSPYRTIDQLASAWRSDHLAVGGGSARGGPDHLAAMTLAKAVGVAPGEAGYVQHDGGGALLAAILGKKVAFGVSSRGEYAGQIESGQLRVLEGVALPANWRGIIAPPGLSTSDERRLLELAASLHASAGWSRALAGHRWTDAYLAGAEFGAFLRAEEAKVAQILSSL